MQSSCLPAATPTVPWWHGHVEPRTAEVGERVGMLRRLIASRVDDPKLPRDLQRQYNVCPDAGAAMIDYVRKQIKAAGIVPDHEQLLVETWRDELGKTNVIIHCPFGQRINQAWAQAIAAAARRVLRQHWTVTVNNDLILLTLADTQGTGLDVSSTQDVVFGAGVATRYVIVNPTDGPVGTPILVTVEAQDQYGNRATGENRGVTLNTTGSANGGGLVTIANGIGTLLINDQVPETVTLTLTDTQGTGLDASSTQDVVFGPVGATRFVILDPPDGPVGTPITVTVQAQDGSGTVITSENRDVTLVTTGSATGGGLVDIQNGVGTRDINDAVPETVTLSLSDTQGTGLDVSSTQTVDFGAAELLGILSLAHLAEMVR